MDEMYDAVRNVTLITYYMRFFLLDKMSDSLLTLSTPLFFQKVLDSRVLCNANTLTVAFFLFCRIGELEGKWEF